MKPKRISTPASAKSGSHIDNLEAIAQLKESATRGELVAIIGSGVSMALTNGKIPSLSWIGLIRDGFSYGVKKQKITTEQATAWVPQLESNDIDDLLCAAEFVSRKLDAPHGSLYARWLENVFNTVKPANEGMIAALVTLQQSQIPICTLNYDPLIEKVLGIDGINLTETGKVFSWIRRDIPGILHLHGSWESPTTCILGIRDYETTLGNEVRDLIQRSLTTFHRLLFIGCGDTFADPNYSALIKWLREKMKTAALQHYALVSSGEVGIRDADPTWQGFVEPIGYGVDYTDLPEYLIKHFSTNKPGAKNGKAGVDKTAGSSFVQSGIIDDYRTFLLRDCGQMTIEGVRADMEIGLRKFDIERLFVPLKVLKCPPEIPETDPEREQKLRSWEEKNKKALPFGKVLGLHKRLALLALPGGGKTLLLKRLTVAYANPTRRRASKDALPSMDIIPVLIRCREWREYIQTPILTILHKLPEITGDSRLSGLGEALLPLFREGRILLLVDGLDEIHNDAHRTIFVEHLEAFLEEYKLTRLVVTSREAGFSLVAPCIARFCDRWRIAPLEEDAITALCDHWQSLMSGDSPQANAESRELAQNLVRNDSLRRLAENPLLLTMLLVVKHGAGRLPPDRVSLYNRAVEVLLDTWNIKGHDPLNPKEAVPQLACVAFQMMRAGKQTATEKELLSLLEEARDRVPQIRRYAKGTPYDFLKRVELRSSLLVEAGHQMEAGQTVPFYQFRHLTFQEYLAAVAAVEGHYMEYNKDDTVLSPLAKFLTAEEWKEVIPMAAVLARKQAEPLIAALVEQASQLRAAIERGEKNLQEEVLRHIDGPQEPPPVARMTQCLVEEAEAAPETLTAALQLIVFFSTGFPPQEEYLKVLSVGPYGAEMLHQTWLLYATMQWPHNIEIMNTFALQAAFRQPRTYWRHKGKLELEQLLQSKRPEEIVRGLFTCAGFYRGSGHQDDKPREIFFDTNFMEDITRHLFADDPALHLAATYALTLMWYDDKLHQIPPPLPSVLDCLLKLRLNGKHQSVIEWGATALSMHLGQPRNEWVPMLTDAEGQQIRLSIETPENYFRLRYYIGLGDLMVAFHARTVLTDDELAKRLAQVIKSKPREDPEMGRFRTQIVRMLEQMSETGSKYL